MTELADKVTKVIKQVDKLLKNLCDNTIELERSLAALKDAKKNKGGRK